MKTIIVGADKQAYFLARDFLSKGHSVTVICPNAQDARWMARRLNATIVLGDGSSPGVLEDAGAWECETVVAATPRDHDNLIICQIAARRFGASMTVAVVNDPDNLEVFPRLGVKNIVSVTEMVSRVAGQRATADSIGNLAVMADGKVNVTELILPEASPVAGKPLSAIGLPKDALVASVIRGEEVLVPRGDTVLAVGDRVVLVALPSHYGQAVKHLTGER